MTNDILYRHDSGQSAGFTPNPFPNPIPDLEAQFDFRVANGAVPGLEERTKGALNELLKLPIIKEGLAKTGGFSPELHYHNLEHTLEVLRDSVMLALHDGLLREQIEILAIAAVYHDLGFLVTRQLNEPIGAQMAVDAMTAHGYAERDIKAVEQAILDTQLKPTADKTTMEQVSHGPISNYLLDGDLGNFGRANFLKKSALVWSEFNNKQPVEPDKLPRSWIEATIKLVSHHKWNSPAAKTLLAEEKERNLARLNGLIFYS